jgi:hypothetical protein
MKIGFYTSDNVKIALDVKRFIGTLLWFAAGVLVGGACT